MNPLPTDSQPSLMPKVRMLVTLGVMLFAGFLIASAVNYLISRNSIRASILRNELPLSSNNIYSEIQRDLFEPILISSLMANDTFVKDWMLHGEQDDASIIKYLKHIQEKYHTITAFLVSEATRRYYHADSVLKTVQEDNPLDAWFFRVRQMKSNYEINVDPDMANRNAMTIFINYRITDKDDHFLGATGVGLSVSSVKTLMQEYRSRYNRDVFFYDRHGKLILHSLDTDSEGERITRHHHFGEDLQPILEKIAAGETSINVSLVGSHGTLTNFRYIPELDWILVVEQTSDGTGSILFKSLALNLIVCLIIAIVLLKVIRQTVFRYQANLESRNQQLHQQNSRIEEQAAELSEVNRQLAAMHREKDEFFGITVHDLKNPLSSVLGMSNLLLQEPSIAGEPREYVSYIATSSRSMLEQAEELLRLTELESPTEIRLEPVSAAQAIRQAAADFHFHAQSKEISLVLDLPEAPLLVRAHEKWLVSSIGNLISNAIKYSPTGAQVTVSLRLRHSLAEISVKDHGGGIPAAEQENLFRKFERLTPRPTAGESSSGLGLYLVRQMVTRMQGQVRCESAEGSGSTFVISLPAA